MLKMVNSAMMMRDDDDDGYHEWWWWVAIDQRQHDSLVKLEIRWEQKIMKRN